MGRAATILGGVLILALVAAGLTEATLAIGGRGSITNDILLRPGTHVTKPTPSPHSSPSPRPSSTPVVTPTATPTITPTPSATPSGPTATTNGFVHLRAQATTSSSILENLNGGTVVQLLSYSNSQWQEVEVDGVAGYIFRSYLDY